MNAPIIQLLVLAGIAIFLILRLKNVLGTREGFEKPVLPKTADTASQRPDFEVIEGGPDRDIIDHVAEGSPAAKALAAMKAAEPSFNVGEFLQGARGAYEMILMGFERGEMAEIKPFLGDEVYQTFAEVVEARHAQGLTIEAEFVGLREMSLEDAVFEEATGRAILDVRFTGELTSIVRDNEGDIIEGRDGKVKRQRDVWSFERHMGADDPNWILVATGE
ncbi:Tim44/TimA family putative adaptor protein [Litorivita sp. NS0012-18]|uniref:Tim44/TimA family putative adaptor protein n=1 Tax=Litorivita sp. NS0012-18 TaxID=3127655 RepID=UPI003107C7EB